MEGTRGQHVPTGAFAETRGRIFQAKEAFSMTRIARILRNIGYQILEALFLNRLIGYLFWILLLTVELRISMLVSMWTGDWLQAWIPSALIGRLVGLVGTVIFLTLYMVGIALLTAPAVDRMLARSSERRQDP